jgi:hypothetical protein
MNSLLKICSNCDDFKDGICQIRFIIKKDKSRDLMPRKPKQKACPVFMYKIETSK